MVFQFYRCINIVHTFDNLWTDFFETFGVGWPEIFAEVETNGFFIFPVI
jgi:hypothetical protein